MINGRKVVGIRVLDGNNGRPMTDYKGYWADRAINRNSSFKGEFLVDENTTVYTARDNRATVRTVIEVTFAPKGRDVFVTGVPGYGDFNAELLMDTPLNGKVVVKSVHEGEEHYAVVPEKCVTEIAKVPVVVGSDLYGKAISLITPKPWSAGVPSEVAAVVAWMALRPSQDRDLILSLCEQVTS